MSPKGTVTGKFKKIDHIQPLNGGVGTEWMATGYPIKKDSQGYLVVETESGRKETVPVTKQTFESQKVGDQFKGVPKPLTKISDFAIRVLLVSLLLAAVLVAAILIHLL